MHAWLDFVIQLQKYISFAYSWSTSVFIQTQSFSGVDSLSLVFNCWVTHKRIIIVSTAWLVSQKFYVGNILALIRFLENVSQKSSANLVADLSNYNLVN